MEPSALERPDRELVELARAGDQAAFGELAERYGQAARRIAARLVADEELLRELVQEALLEAYLSLERLREPDHFKSWLFGITLNLCRSALREQKRKGWAGEGWTETELSDLLLLHTQPPDPEERAIERELFNRILQAMQELPAQQREVTLLYYFEFLSLDEVAAIAGISAGAVKVRLHRARDGLRQRLRQTDPEIEVVRGKQARRKKMLTVRIVDVIKRDGKTVVLLMDEPGRKLLPIWIGSFEATSIAAGVRGFQAPRPMTFDFIANLLGTLGAALEEVRIQTLQGDTFYGVAKLRLGDRMVEVDARPSDALALAVRTGSPIYVAEEVMERAGKTIREGAEMPGDLETGVELPPPTGEEMDVLVKELEVILRNPFAAGEGSESKPCW